MTSGSGDRTPSAVVATRAPACVDAPPPCRAPGTLIAARHSQGVQTGARALGVGYGILGSPPGYDRDPTTKGILFMAISANLDKVLDKAYEASSLAELVDAPVSALAGVSDADAEALTKAFNIKTIGDLATNKYIRAATAIAEIAAIAK